MTGVKSLALGLCVVAILATTARADVIDGAGTTQWLSWSNWSIYPQTPIAISPVAPAAEAVSSPASTVNATPAPSELPSAVVTPMPTSTPNAAFQADAFLNFGSGPYPDAAGLTTGTAQSFQNSPVLQSFLGPNPTAQQLNTFEQTVLQRVQQTYQQSGIPIRLTLDPTVSAAHTMSIVSNAYYAANSQAVGITDVGQNGFVFLDKFTGATTLDQLEWALAHNISHELMHAFGIGFHPDQTGTYIDSGIASWSLMTNPNSGFSPAAAQLLRSTNLDAIGNNVAAPGAQVIDGDQVITPEPATLVLWTAGLLGAWAARQRRKTVCAR